MNKLNEIFIGFPNPYKKNTKDMGLLNNKKHFQLTAVLITNIKQKTYNNYIWWEQKIIAAFTKHRSFIEEYPTLLIRL